MPGALHQILQAKQHEFGKLVHFDRHQQRLIAMDFTEGNTELVPELLDDTKKFSSYVSMLLHREKAIYGIGGYAEHRTIYSASSLFDAQVANEEPRRLHLGLDIWGAYHSPVFAPIEGIIHSKGNNIQRGDYGATLILSHQLDGVSFHTLYGHLSRNSISDATPGDHVRAGDVIGEFGMPSENGQWPPHLHFQIIEDIGEWEGDYPGVCRFSEREQWMKNCPDPDLIARLNRFL